MIAATNQSPPTRIHDGGEKAITLALTLAQAEKAILEFSESQVDAIVDADGRAYLLRPAQESLRQNERRLQAMIDSAADVITVVDREGRIVSQNRAVTRLLGYQPEKLIGGSLFELIDEEDVGQLRAAFSNVIDGFQETATVHFRHSVRGGTYRRIEATLSKLHDDTVGSVILIARPFIPTAVPDAPHLLSTDRFLAMLSHELRTPLTPVLLGIDELQQDERFAEAEATLTMMRRNLDLQVRLLGDLVDFTSIGQHKLRLHLDAIDAYEVIRFVQEICRAELAAAQVELRLDLHATDSAVMADSLRLQQVLWNLLKNAIKFSTPGSIISIRTFDGLPGQLVIEVVDQGIGIEPALLPLVFDCFQQGEISGRPSSGSLGLGLYIAKGMAEAQDGTLTVHSAGRGTGATFSLTLLKAASDHFATQRVLHPETLILTGDGFAP